MPVLCNRIFSQLIPEHFLESVGTQNIVQKEELVPPPNVRADQISAVLNETLALLRVH